MQEITKGTIHMVFLEHHRNTTGTERERALKAYAKTLDQLAPWRENLPDEEKARMHTISSYLDQILEDDFGIKTITTRSFTLRETEGCKAGGRAAAIFLRATPEQIPKLPDSPEAKEIWIKTVKGMGFALLPADRVSDKEWVYGFLSAWTGDLWLYANGQEPIGE